MLYKGNTPKEPGRKIAAGAYKFSIQEVKMYNDDKSIGCRCKLWGEEKEPVSDKVWFFINIDPKAKDAIKAETDRKLTTLLGKPEINSEKELIGKAGYIVMRETAKGSEPMPFGGLYDTNKKSAAGNETMLDRIQEALAYKWENDPFAVKRQESTGTPAQKPTDDDTLPF